MTTLDDWARELLCRLPVDETDSIALPASAFPTLPESLECSDLVIQRGFHDYDTWRVDYPQWSGSKEVLGSLGIAILGSLFQRLESVCVHLTSRQSEIKTLVIVRPPAIDGSTGIELLPASFHYKPSPVRRHPWTENPPAPEDLPWFKLTNAEDIVINDDRRARRDCLHGFGSVLGSARFARLLLDLSRPSSSTTEVALECEAGFRGVAPASAEVRIWLPGGVYWDPP